MVFRLWLSPVISSIAMIGMKILPQLYSWELYSGPCHAQDCWFVLVLVIHAEKPYSRCGWTLPWYSVLSNSKLAHQVVPVSLRRVGNFLCAFAANVILGLHVSRLSKITAILVASSIFPRTVSQKCWFWSNLCFVDEVKSVMHDLSVLSVFSFTHQSSAHAVVACFCTKAKSSAECWTALILFSRSATNKRTKCQANNSVLGNTLVLYMSAIAW